MQGIVDVFGGQVVKAPLPMHGKISPVTHTQQSVFKGVPDQLEVMRYHSLIADAGSLPDCLEATAAVGSLEAAHFEQREHWEAAGSSSDGRQTPRLSDPRHSVSPRILCHRRG